MAGYEAALAQDPKLSDARVNLGVVLGMLGRHREGIAQIQAVLVRQPADPTANRSLAAMLSASGRPAEALEAIERLRQQAPSDLELLFLHARALSGRHRLGEAAVLLQQVVDARPENVPARADLASHLAMLGETQAAGKVCADGLARFAGDELLLLTQGFVAFQSGDFLRARANYERALERNAEIPRGRFHLALLDLLEGDFAAGWPLFEHRWDDPNGWLPGRTFAQTQWRGETDISSASLLVHCEQGLGDTLQFCRYVPLLAPRVRRVVLEVQAPVLGIVRRSMPDAVMVVAQGSTLPPFDRVCPLLSLPLVFSTNARTIPSALSYLQPDPERVQRWRSRLGDARGVRIGIAWSGSSAHNGDRQRSIGLDRLAGLLRSTHGAEWG